MPRRTLDEPDDDSDWGDDSDGSYSCSDYPDDDEATIECPYCGEEIHEDSPRCPHCDRYLSDEDSAPPRKPWWIIVGTLACLYIVYRWTVG